MKRNLLLWICLCIANIAFSQTTHLTDLGVLATVSVDLIHRICNGLFFLCQSHQKEQVLMLKYMVLVNHE